MARPQLYFNEDAGPYKAGLWYDNVPDGDVVVALKKGYAVECKEAPCGCLVTSDTGRAVRVGFGAGNFACPEHEPNAINPATVKKKAAEQLT